MKDLFHNLFRLAFASSAFLLSLSSASASCSFGAYSGPEDNVMRAYIAYYGRPADSGGLAYWAGRMSAEGGSLNSIIADFGASKEFTDRYGGLTATDLVKGIYRQLFGRDPDAAGLNYYVGELTARRRTLQTIALDVLFGAQNADALIVTNRLAAAKNFTSGSMVAGVSPADFDGDAMAAVLASVLDDVASRDAACAYYDAMLDALNSNFARTFAVTKTVDSNDGSCNADCSLREAVAAANSAGSRAAIILPAGTYVLPLGQLMVTGNVHLRGAGAAISVIDGNAANRMFVLESPAARLVLSRLTLANGNGDFGGAILSKGTTILDRVTLATNRSRNGGAIINAGTLVGFNVTLNGNQATSLDASTGYGGGLYNETGSYGLFASRVTGNTAPYNGGGIYSAGNGVIVNSVISGNQSGAIGGGIDGLGPIRIIGSRFASNIANDGGALASREAGAKITVTTSSFDDNVASGRDLGGGGAAFNYFGVLTFTDSTFSRNQAFGEGGGAIETHGALKLVNSVFDGNRAEMHSGSLSNSAPGLGGALLVIDGSTVQIDNARFVNNVAGNSGGAIYNDQRTQLVVAGSLFQSNEAKGLFAGPGGFGGAIFNEGNVTLSNSTLTSNTSKESGGALSSSIGTATISNGTVSGNKAGNGAGIVAYSGTLTVIDAVLRSNVATNWGGGLLNDSAQSALTRVTASDNQAKYGGGFSNNNAAGRVSLDASTISGNSASSDGSAFVNFGTVNVKSTTISGTCNNHATVNNQGGNTSSCKL